MSTPFNCQKHFYFKLFSLAKTFLIQTIQFGMSAVSMSKTLLLQTIQFSISTQDLAFNKLQWLICHKT